MKAYTRAAVSQAQTFQDFEDLCEPRAQQCDCTYDLPQTRSGIMGGMHAFHVPAARKLRASLPATPCTSPAGTRNEHACVRNQHGHTQQDGEKKWQQYGRAQAHACKTSSEHDPVHAHACKTISDRHLSDHHRDQSERGHTSTWIVPLLSKSCFSKASRAAAITSSDRLSLHEDMDIVWQPCPVG